MEHYKYENSVEGREDLQSLARRALNKMEGGNQGSAGNGEGSSDDIQTLAKNALKSFNNGEGKSSGDDI